MTGIYVHIPFCKAKCHYCDFVSFAQKEEYFEAYKNALVSEIKHCDALKDQVIHTIFIGGGTPTVLPPAFIAEIMDAMRRFSIAGNAEITIEANPGTLNRNMLKDLKSMGINRLSIGLQTWQDSLLAKLGRIHTAQMFLDNYNEAVQTGFDNINVDVIFSLPGQTLENWHETLENVTLLQPQHLSAYSLIVEDGTAFGALFHAGKLKETDDDTDRAMYDMTKKRLEQHGYEHYEISNFAKPGFFSRHNACYWERGAYMGFGLNAHSFFGGKRFSNTCDLNAYIKANGDRAALLAEETVITETCAMEEFMFLGLRMLKGVDAYDFKAAFGKDIFAVFQTPINEHVKNGLITVQNECIALTEKGIDVSNVIFADFLL